MRGLLPRPESPRPLHVSLSRAGHSLPPALLGPSLCLGLTSRGSFALGKTKMGSVLGLQGRVEINTKGEAWGHHLGQQTKCRSEEASSVPEGPLGPHGREASCTLWAWLACLTGHPTTCRKSEHQVRAPPPDYLQS